MSSPEETSTYCRQRAEEARTRAQASTAVGLRADFLDMAHAWEQKAIRAEEREQAKPSQT